MGVQVRRLPFSTAVFRGLSRPSRAGVCGYRRFHWGRQRRVPDAGRTTRARWAGGRKTPPGRWGHAGLFRFEAQQASADRSSFATNLTGAVSARTEGTASSGTVGTTSVICPGVPATVAAGRAALMAAAALAAALAAARVARMVLPRPPSWYMVTIEGAGSATGRRRGQLQFCAALVGRGRGEGCRSSPSRL